MEIDKNTSPTIKDSVYIIFPEIQIEALATDPALEYNLKQRLPFLMILFKSLSAKFWQSGEHLEHIAIEAMLHRLGLTVFSSPNITYGETYAFLRDSFISKEKVIFDTNQLRGKFPKFTKGKNALCPDTNNRKEFGSFKKQLEKCFQDTRDTDLLVDPDCKETVLELAKLGVIYVSSKASNAADVYVKGQGWYLGIQFKSGKEPFGITDLIEETSKAILSKKYKFVFIIAAENMIQHFKNNKDKCKLLKHNETPLAIQYEPLSQIKTKVKVKYDVPENVQIIILLQEGIKYLIGDINYRLLNGDDIFNVVTSCSHQIS